jgi:hypothetical protein
MTEQIIKKSNLWFHVFCGFIESGKLAKASGSSVKVYLVIKSHVSLKHGLTNISIQKISEKSGLSISQVKREIKILLNDGILKKTKLGRSNNYQITEQLLISAGENTLYCNWEYIPLDVKTIFSDINHLKKNNALPTESKLEISGIRKSLPPTLKDINISAIPSETLKILEKNSKINLHADDLSINQ